MKVYWRPYESRRSSKHKLHQKTKQKIKYGKNDFHMADGILIPCNVARS